MNETELKIYTEAKKLFYKQGYYDTTVRQITNAANVNSGLFNYYFKNKYNLAILIYDEIFYNVRKLTKKYYGDEKNPAIFMGVMMRMHTYILSNGKTIKFVIDALKEGIFEESVFKTSTQMVRDTAIYYNKTHTEEEIRLLLSITLASEKATLTQKFKGCLSYDLKKIADIVYKIHLNGFNMKKEEIKRCTDIVTRKFQVVIDDNPNFIDLFI